MEDRIKSEIMFEGEYNDGLDDGDAKAIVCPICQFEYVHHQSKTVIVDGRDAYKASRNVRGTVITIPMKCEHNHQFILQIGFHKGKTLVWLESNEDQWFQVDMSSSS